MALRIPLARRCMLIGLGMLMTATVSFGESPPPALVLAELFT